MTIDQLGSIGEFSSAILLFVSLIYVGWQIRQNTHATRAEIYQLRSDQVQQLMLFQAGSQEMAEIMEKVEGDQGIDVAKIATLIPVERRRFQSLQAARRNRIDNMWYQYQNGFLDEEYYTDHVRSRILALVPIWEALGLSSGRPSFLEEIDRIVAEAKRS
jgi:hypothetical protein